VGDADLRQLCGPQSGIHTRIMHADVQRAAHEADIRDLGALLNGLEGGPRMVHPKAIDRALHAPLQLGRRPDRDQPMADQSHAGA